MNKVWYIPRDNLAYIKENTQEIFLKTGEIINYNKGDIIFTTPLSTVWEE